MALYFMVRTPLYMEGFGMKYSVSMLAQCIPEKSLPSGSGNRLYLICILILSFILLNSYKACLISFLLKPATNPPLNTVGDLEKSSLTVLAVKGTNMARLFNDNPILNKRQGFAGSLEGYEMVKYLCTCIQLH